MIGRYEEFPLIAEMLERAVKIRHRHRRAIETGRMRAAAKAEQDGLKLSRQVKATQQILGGFFDGLKLSMVISKNSIKQSQRSQTSEPVPVFRPIFRRSYNFDSWIDRYLSER
jgi:hypothetical protein